MHLISSRDKRCPRVPAEFPSGFGASEAALAEGGEKTTFTIAASRLDEFTKLILERIRSRAKDFTLIQHKDCGYVLYRWKEWSDSEEVNTWLQQVITDPVRAVTTLRHLTSVVIINATKKEPVFHGESVESLVDLKMLYEAVNVLPSEELTPEDQVNISLLGRAIKRKSEGKPYAEVRPKDSLF